MKKIPFLTLQFLGMAAAQLKVPTGAWHFYAERHETHREHLLELQEQFGFQTFTSAHFGQFAAELVSLADQTHQGILLAQAPSGKSSESQNHHSGFTGGGTLVRGGGHPSAAAPV